MWTMDCGVDNVNEIKVISPLVAPNNSNDSDCTSAKIIKPSILKHLVSERKIGGNGRSGLQSTRWSPTPEQLMALEELYKHGTRTPTAFQIQDITVKLRRFGKIEGKNVFYWFQNHKARDKKKQRLRLEAQRRLFHHQSYSKTKHLNHQSSAIQKVTSLEVEQTKREPLSNCSTISEESGSAPKATTHSRILKFDHDQQKDESQLAIKAKDCFPMITRPNNSLISMAFENNNYLETPHDYTPGLTRLFSNIFGYNYNNYNNNYGMIRESISTNSTTKTLELFPLQSGNLKALNFTTTTSHSHDHEDATKNMPFVGDLFLSL